MWSPRAELRRWFKPVQPLLWSAGRVHDLHGGQHESFAAWCAAHPGSRCEVWLGAEALHELLPETGLPLAGAAGRLDWARRVFVHYHGDAATAWPLAAWAGAAPGVTALHGVDLQGWRAVAAEHGVALAAVKPLWPQLLQLLLRQRPPLRQQQAASALLVEQAWVTVVALRRGTAVAVHRRRLPQGDAAAVLRRAQQESAPGEAPAAVLWLGQDAPAGSGLDLQVVAEPAAALRASRARAWHRRAPGVDFQRALPRPGPTAWAFCGVSLLVLAVAAADGWTAWRASNAALALALPPAVSQRNLMPLPIAGPALADAAARRRLAYPWPAVFAATEAGAGAGVVWLGLEHGQGGELRLQGLAPAAAQAQRAAAAVRLSPQWERVTVARLEAVQGGQAFELVARGPGPVVAP